jgi:hypothetical protein
LINQFLAIAGDHPEKIKLAKLGNDPSMFDTDPDFAQVLLATAEEGLALYESR